MSRAAALTIIVLLALSVSLNLVNYYSNQQLQEEVSTLQSQYSKANQQLQNLSQTLSTLQTATTTVTSTETITVTVAAKPAGVLTPQEVFELAENSVVQIVTSRSSLEGGGGLGSGFIYSEDGYIVTNNHVVEGANTIEVRFVDGSSYEAEIAVSYTHLTLPTN